MWIMTTPWYELVFRAFLIYLFLLAVFRVAGKKPLGEISPFDFVLLMLISEAVQNGIVGEDHSIPSAIIVVLSLIGMDYVFKHITYKSPQAEKIIEGQPICLIRDGKINQDVLDKEKITITELEKMLREQGIIDLKDVYLAILENNGKVSMIKKSDTPTNSKIMHSIKMFFTKKY